MGQRQTRREQQQDELGSRPESLPHLGPDFAGHGTDDDPLGYHEAPHHAVQEDPADHPEPLWDVFGTLHPNDPLVPLDDELPSGFGFSSEAGPFDEGFDDALGQSASGAHSGLRADDDHVQEVQALQHSTQGRARRSAYGRPSKERRKSGKYRSETQHRDDFSWQSKATMPRSTKQAADSPAAGEPLAAGAPTSDALTMNSLYPSDDDALSWHKKLPVAHIARVNNQVSTTKGFRESEEFHRLLEQFYDRTTDRCSLAVAVDWEVPEFCATELDSCAGRQPFDNVTKILTVTSPGVGLTTAQAASCEDYTKLVWGSRGLRILRFVLRSIPNNPSLDKPSRLLVNELTLELSFKESSLSDLETPIAILDVTGRPRSVADVLEQFAWIASTFRPGISRYPLSRSTVDIAIVSSRIDRPRFSLNPLTALTESSCWTSIIPCAVVATGFPIRTRFSHYLDMGVEGMEIPFEIMVSLARVTALTESRGRQMLVGLSMVLFPSKLLWDHDTSPGLEAVQWHCVQRDGLNDLEVRSIARVNIFDNDCKISIAGLRCFLGYFDRATVHLGTEAPSEKQATSLGLPVSGQKTSFAREATLTLGFNIPGIINGSIAGKVLLTQSLQVALGESKEYEQLLTDSKRQPVILYDVEAQTGWLVSELSVILQMCLVFLRMPSTQPRFRGTIPKLSFARAMGDGGSSAEEFILANGEANLWKKIPNNEYKKFHSLVNDFLRDVRTLRIASLLHQRSSSTTVFPVLNGLDFADIVAMKDRIHEKQLRTKTPFWRCLSGEQKTYTIFCTGLGQVIRPASQVPCGWESVLKGARLLVASIPCLRQLNSDANHPGGAACSCYHLTDELVWTGTSCRHCRDAPMNMVQGLRSLPKRFHVEVPPPAQLPSEDGALVFGEHSLFHAAVAQLGMEQRRLDRQLRANDALQPAETATRKRTGTAYLSVLSNFSGTSSASLAGSRKSS